jgi:hypothetical protein
VVAVAEDESEAVRSEARSVLLKIASYQLPQLRKHIKKLVPTLKASLDAITQLDYESELGQEDEEPQRRDAFNDIFDD